MSTPPTAPAAVPVLVEPTKVRAADGSVRQVSVPPAAPPVRRGSLAEIPFDNAREAPADAVLSRKQPDGGWRDVSAADFADEVLAVAKGLIAEGLGAGDRIAIMARTTYEWTLLDFAAWAAGLVTVPIYPTSSAFQTRWILQDSGAVACAVETADQGRLISQERKQLGDLAHLWQFDTGALGRLKTLGRDVSDDTVAARRATLEPETPATLIYTSGTTGRPKGCVLSHGNFFAEVDNAIELLHPVFKSVSEDPASTLLFLPLSHVFGRMVAIGCLRARVRLGHAPSIQTEDLLADLAGFKPTFLLAIPYVLEKVYNTGRATAEKMGRASSFDRAARIAQRYGEAVEAAEHGTGPGPGLGLRAARALYDPLVYRRIRAALGGHVRYAICGGSPLGHRLAAFYAGAGIEIFEGYGLTETTAAATVTPPLKPRLGTVGWPLPGTAVRIADDGEVLLGGGQVCQGYWDAEQGRPVPVAGGRLVRHRGPGRARRGRLPHDHRPQEGHHHHLRRQERHPGTPGGLAARPPPGQPVHGGRRQPLLHHRPDHPGARRARPLAADEEEAERADAGTRRRRGAAHRAATRRRRGQPAGLPRGVDP
ncbi:AMP-binding protein [Streptomyces sp. NBC_00987]|nr:AMP-binding protein [Streptomyces sp. NBC_00987]